MWQTKYAAAIPKNLGVGVNFRLCSEGDFLSGRPQSVGITVRHHLSFLTQLHCVDYSHPWQTAIVQYSLQTKMAERPYYKLQIAIFTDTVDDCYLVVNVFSLFQLKQQRLKNFRFDSMIRPLAFGHPLAPNPTPQNYFTDVNQVCVASIVRKVDSNLSVTKEQNYGTKVSGARIIFSSELFASMVRVTQLVTEGSY